MSSLTFAQTNDTFLELFENPEKYLGGIIIITMTVLLIYFIFRRRK